MYRIEIKKDLLDPFNYFFSENEKKFFYLEYQRQWSEINILMEHYLTDEQKRDIDEMKKNKKIHIQYPSEYTIKRESELKKKLISNIVENPFYYLFSRIYNFFRILVSGLSPDFFKKDLNLLIKDKIILVLPFIITVFFILSFFLFNSFILIAKHKKIKIEIWFIYIIIIYVMIIHTPFPIQARYSVPVHYCILAIFSLLFNLESFLKKK